MMFSVVCIAVYREDSYATADVAQAHSFQDAILPIAQVLIEHFNFKVIRFYNPDSDFNLELSDIEPRKESEEANVATTAYQSGIITKNEARRRIGEVAVEGGDEFAEQGGGGQVPEEGREGVNLSEKALLDAKQNKKEEFNKDDKNAVPKDSKNKNSKVTVAANRRRRRRITVVN